MTDVLTSFVAAWLLWLQPSNKDIETAALDFVLTNVAVSILIAAGSFDGAASWFYLLYAAKESAVGGLMRSQAAKTVYGMSGIIALCCHAEWWWLESTAFTDSYYPLMLMACFAKFVTVFRFEPIRIFWHAH